MIEPFTEDEKNANVSPDAWGVWRNSEGELATDREAAFAIWGDEMEFVVFNSHGAEVDWIDPVHSVTLQEDGSWNVDNGFFTYNPVIPEGGTFVVRERMP